MTAWSLLTMLCGLAQNFGQLLLLRVGVGVGEAGCTAPSHSMIADAIAPDRRSQALSIYNLGGTCGTMLGAMSGGVIAEHIGWRAAFLIVGAPGLILAIFIRLRGRDPGRKQLDVATGTNGPDVSAAAVARTILWSPALRHLALGLTLSTFAVAGLAAFVQPYYIRNFGLSYGQVGLMFGAVTGVAGMLSLLVSGRLADALTRRDARWYAWLPAIGVGIAVPVSVVAYTAPQWPVALALTLVSTFFVGWFVAPTIGGFHNVVGPRRVAMAIALLLMFQNLVGFGAGPCFTGMAIDFFARHTPSARATQLGLLATLLLEPWAIVHFLLAARSLRRELAPVPTA
jgi:predicted MFS family arabinose efflux permease